MGEEQIRKIKNTASSWIYPLGLVTAMKDTKGKVPEFVEAPNWGIEKRQLKQIQIEIKTRNQWNPTSGQEAKKTGNDKEPTPEEARLHLKIR